MTTISARALPTGKEKRASHLEVEEGALVFASKHNMRPTIHLIHGIINI